MDSIGSNMFCPNEPGIFKHLYDKILHDGDYYFHLADFQSYIDTQERTSQDYKDTAKWAKMAILNTARTGKFSSDRTIEQYAKDIWGVKPVL
ncbi:MAG TPA: glycogen/starch/alpha-glucan phosphorylase, partial [Thermodesulfovibrionia bacterium]|nr:glycogen/starch/alpha-glucan phosphorylase [Thermodesulfovibrionia bacterium]